MSPEKLVYMANQIATFFAASAPEQAVVATADHLRKFWEPRMRAAIVAYLDAGGEGLNPTARAAVAALRPAKAETSKA